MCSPHKTSPPKYLATYNLMCLEGIQPNQFKGLQVLKLHLNKCLVCQGMRFHKKHVEFLGVPDFFPLGYYQSGAAGATHVLQIH